MEHHFNFYQATTKTQPSRMAYNQYCSDGKWPFGGEGEPDDIPVPNGDAAVKISEILAAADAGEYTFGGCADTLPALPGLYIDGVGLVSLPLTQEQATAVIAKCQKSPFGHNMDTKMDESVRKSWQLSPDQVQMKNPSWQTGLEKLTETIGDRLGYKGIKLQCVLYKLLVYEEGGHFLKHQDTEKEDRMIATLVIQPPSTHDGGDLVVYRNGEVASRHDFGKSEGTAAFFNHYAVHYADAEHALEKVTKGYRLALVYSVCLPIEMQNLKQNRDYMVYDLAGVIRNMDQGQKIFTLLLSHEYTTKTIEDLGYKALKGIDRARFLALEKANALVPVEKKLHFFIVKLSQRVSNSLGEDGWENMGFEQTVHWYISSFGHFVTDTWNNFMPILNFLNPGHETFLDFWKAFGTTRDVYTGNDGVVRETKYLRFGIVICSEVKYIVTVACFLPPEIAAELLLSFRRRDAELVKLLLVANSEKVTKWHTAFYLRYPAKVCLRFSRAVCDLLLDTNDSKLVAQFFADYCARLGYLEGNKSLLPRLTKVIRKFNWSVIGAAVLQALGNTTNMVETKYFDDDDTWEVIKVGGFENDSSAELLLQVANGLSEGEARRSIVKAAVVNGLDVRSAALAQILWEYATTHAEIIEDIVTKLELKEPHELLPFTECFAQYIAGLDEDDETFAKLQSIAAKRCKWLREETQRLEMPFTWEMPYAKKTKDEILDFLRGPDEMMMKNFSRYTFFELQHFVQECLKHGGPWHASVTVEIVSDEKASSVKITKTRKWFESERAKIPEYKSELKLLDDLGKLACE